MGRYFLSDIDRQRFEMRARWSALSEDARDGEFRLYNKNGGETLFVRPVAQVPHEMTWIVECDDVPEYFRSILREVN